MGVVRAFIAVNLPPPILAELSRTSQSLRARLEGLPLRWSQPANLHLTLKFLGNVSEANLEPLAQFMDAEAIQTSPFAFSVGGLGAFPNLARPRVLWVGIQPREDLAALQRRIEQMAGQLGYPPEERPFTPHLTLARVQRGARLADVRRIGETLNEVSGESLGTAAVESVHLYRSDLQPAGPVYTCLHSAPFSPRT